jgi:hypothetical protein
MDDVRRRSTCPGTRGTLALAAFCLWSTSPPLSGQCLGPEQRITASDADDADRFGHSVDVFGDLAVVGAPGDDEEATNAGAAYVFQRENGVWTELQKLTAGDDAVQFDEFGWDVDVEGDLIAVGAPGDDDAGNDSGAVYLFEWNGASWEEITKLLPADMSNAAYTFGTSVDIGIDVPDENPPNVVTVVAVGAPRADVFEGVVFLYQRVGPAWPLIGRLVDSDTMGPNDNGELGASIAVRGDALLSGSPLDDQLGGNVGTAYLFGRGQIIDSWVESVQYDPTDPAPGDGFGTAVAVARRFDTYVVAIGAPSVLGPGAGRAFVWDSVGPPEVLTEGGNQDAFGAALALFGRTLVVGAHGDDEGGQDAGAIYVYTQDELGVWQSDGKILASDAGVEKEFGWAVAARHGSVIVGAPEEDALTPGTAYLYDCRIFGDGFESGGLSSWTIVR